VFRNPDDGHRLSPPALVQKDSHHRSAGLTGC
jgi:hypothetical protein